MKALITGAGGQLASDLEAMLDGAARAYSHSDLDISDTSAVEHAISETRPDVVFNCAAFHNVDVCERESQAAWAVNALAVRELARRSERLVHISTNYVFDGRGAEPYGEDDLPSPRSTYAITKLTGEHLALAYCRGSLVVRSAGLYGAHGSASKGGNFVQRMIARAREQGSLSVVADQRLQPTYTGDLARAILEAVEDGVRGLIHLTASGACSWHEFAAAIVQHAGLDVPVEPTRTIIEPGQPDRPLNGVLARPRADSLGLTPLRPWQEALAEYMAEAGLMAN